MAEEQTATLEAFRFRSHLCPMVSSATFSACFRGAVEFLVTFLVALIIQALWFEWLWSHFCILKTFVGPALHQRGRLCLRCTLTIALSLRSSAFLKKYAKYFFIAFLGWLTSPLFGDFLGYALSRVLRALRTFNRTISRRNGA